MERCLAKVWGRNEGGYEVWDRCHNYAREGEFCKRHAAHCPYGKLTAEELAIVEKIEKESKR